MSPREASYDLMPESRYPDDERCEAETRRGACAKAWAYRNADGKGVCWHHWDGRRPQPPEVGR